MLYILNLELLRHKKISSELHQQVVRLFGREGIVEITALMGSYVTVGFLMDAIDQQQPPSRPPLAKTGPVTLPSGRSSLAVIV